MGDEVLGTDVQAARGALAQSSRAGAVGRRAARRSLWRHCIAAAFASTACLLIIGSLDRWIDGSLPRALLNAVIVGSLAGLVMWRLQLEQVRATVTRRQKIGVAFGGILVFAVPAGAGPAYLPAYPIGAAGIFAFWLCAAWWMTREQ